MGQVKPGQFNAVQLGTGQIWTVLFMTGKLRICQVGYVDLGQVKLGQVKSSQVNSGQVRSRQVISGQLNKF